MENPLSSVLTEGAFAPKVAIVIPLFMHSELVVEAVTSALAQVAPFAILTVIVNDGCPFPDSHFFGLEAQLVGKGRVIYVAKKNGGLSAARNTGIEIALQQFPSVEAIYFLDSDNRLSPRSIATAFSTLHKSGADWVYPNIDMFGSSDVGVAFETPYSVLTHTFQNICEAGSLVHRRIFEAGVRFDETMLQGFEDWDFWLTAVSLGFRGVNEPHFGFRYRKRPESMLSASERSRDEILSYLRRKHRTLYDPKFLRAAEHEELPRYAIVDSESGAVALTSDPATMSESMGITEFMSAVARGIVSPVRSKVPHYLIWTSAAFLRRLQAAKLLHWVFWDLERRLMSKSFYGCRFASEERELFLAIRDGGPALECGLIGLRSETLETVLKDPAAGPVESLASVPDLLEFAVRTIDGQIVDSHDLPTTPHVRLVADIVKIRERFPYNVLRQRWDWRSNRDLERRRAVDYARAPLDGEIVFPWVDAPGPHVGFVLPLADFGGVERVAHSVAVEMRKAGWTPHLFIFDAGQLHLPAEFRDTYESINFLDEPHAFDHSWDSEYRYLGTGLPKAGLNSPFKRAIGLLAWCDLVINCHSAGANVLAGRLQSQDISTATYVHVIDRTAFGRDVGHPYFTLAYEHSYKFVLCCSRTIGQWIAAMGLPADKIVVAPNAAGYPLDDELVSNLVGQRSVRQHNELRVLSLGRLDRQKGLAYVEELIRASRERQMPIRWRVVGKPVMDGHSSHYPNIGSVIEPPRYNADDLTELYNWADVLILMSDYEGLPLSVLEAMRVGCAPLVTNVGANAEIIVDGQTGFLVDPAKRVAQAITVFEKLIADPAQLAPLALAAAASVKGRSWHRAVAPLIAKVAPVVQKARSKRKEWERVLKRRSKPRSSVKAD